MKCPICKKRMTKRRIWATPLNEMEDEETYFISLGRLFHCGRCDKSILLQVNKQTQKKIWFKIGQALPQSESLLQQLK
jgi:hypothetical protein